MYLEVSDSVSYWMQLWLWWFCMISSIYIYSDLLVITHVCTALLPSNGAAAARICVQLALVMLLLLPVLCAPFAGRHVPAGCVCA
jgi:hypothetical protein